jgi:hypothetical protein
MQSPILWRSKCKSKHIPGKEVFALSNPRMLPFHHVKLEQASLKRIWKS